MTVPCFRLTLFVSLLLACLGGAAAAAEDAGLAVTIDGRTRQFMRAELLARRDAAGIVIARDAAYGRTMRYRAVPLRAILGDLGQGAADTFEFRATDGFVAQIPRTLIEGEAFPWLAVEDPLDPWPRLPGKSFSAGPYYVVWQNGHGAGISPEQWPYAVAAIAAVQSPPRRWPSIAVDAAVPAGSPLRRGQEVFVANCLACHRLNGAGEASVGPDLLSPMAVTTYLTDAGLRALIRNPAAVRTWPEQRMPAFDATAIDEGDMDALVAYLRHLAARER